jgi:hypothetical protein
MELWSERSTSSLASLSYGAVRDSLQSRHILMRFFSIPFAAPWVGGGWRGGTSGARDSEKFHSYSVDAISF